MKDDWYIFLGVGIFIGMVIIGVVIGHSPNFVSGYANQQCKDMDYKLVSYVWEDGEYKEINCDVSSATQIQNIVGQDSLDSEIITPSPPEFNFQHCIDACENLVNKNSNYCYTFCVSERESQEW